MEATPGLMQTMVGGRAPASVFVCGEGDGCAEGYVVKEFRDAGFAVVGFEEGAEAVGGVGA